jgi:endonuclease/exonuclease/phosphatase family metal-dependent hydrolase
MNKAGLVRLVALFAGAGGLILLLASAFGRDLPKEEHAAMPQAAPFLLRVMSANLHVAAGPEKMTDAGVSVETVQKNLETFARIAQREQVDVLLVQEVDFGAARSGHVEQGEWIAKTLNMHQARAVTLDTRVLDAQKRAAMPPVLRDCLYGLVLFSRFPIESVNIIELPNPPEDGDWPLSESRALLMTTLKLPVGPITVATTHLDYRSRQTRLGQLRVIADALAPRSAWVLGGDFNEPYPPMAASAPHADYLIPHHGLTDLADWPADWPTLLGIAPPAQVLDRQTFKVTQPMAVLDHVFSAGRAQVTRLSWVDSAGVSDHHFVLAEVEIAPQTDGAQASASE